MYNTGYLCLYKKFVLINSNIPLIVIGAIAAIVLLFVAALLFFNARIKKLQQQKANAENKYKELELQVQSLELETIKYKLNPHLFKNTLNSIQSHAYQTYYALDKLANVLDYILYESNQKFVSLKEEIEFAMSLIEINRLKISPLFDLRITNKINETEILYEQKLIAPLITVDLIENAFKHADLQNADAFISVMFELKENVFVLTVSNKISSKAPIKKTNSGFGKESLRKRLAIIYKDNYKLHQFVENDVHIAHLKINLFDHKAQMFATR